MAPQDEPGLNPVGAGGAQIKQAITDAKITQKTETFDPGASHLGTDNEAGALPDPDGMAQARKAPKPQ
ncbi:MAG: hypothetical protein ACRYHQ_03845 [Janthinobacterium lividum]